MAMILCHGDSYGEVFCNWSPTKKALAVYITEEVPPPSVRELGITVNPETAVDLDTLVWRPFVLDIGYITVVREFGDDKEDGD